MYVIIPLLRITFSEKFLEKKHVEQWNRYVPSNVFANDAAAYLCGIKAASKLPEEIIYVREVA